MRTTRSNRAAFSLSPLVAALACALAPTQSFAVTYTVNTVADGGPGSLRDAITLANTNCSSDPSPLIQFNFTGTGPFVIAPSTPLPDVNCVAGIAYTPTINGYSQSGASANTSTTGFNALIQVGIDGSSPAVSGFCGLNMAAPGPGAYLTVKGLRIQNYNYGGSGTALCGFVRAYGNVFTGNYQAVNVYSGSAFGDATAAGRNVVAVNAYGVTVSGRSSVSVVNNFIGTMDGTTASGNNFGIDWGNSLGTIAGNVISGNSTKGLYLHNDAGTTVSANKIGTDASGNAALGNGYGIVLDTTSGTQVLNNVISGNAYGGILSSADSGSMISGNKVGTNLAGTTAIANQSFGIDMSNPSSTSIVNNVVSGNLGPGISLFSLTNVLVKDNTIGTNAAASAPLPNTEGVTTYCGNNLTLQDNLIAGNSSTGVRLSGTAGPGSPPLVAAPVDGLKAASPPNILYNRIGVVSFTTAMPNGGDGILIGFGDCSTTSNGNGLLQNWIANNQGMGITLQAGTGNTLSQNTVYDNVVKNIDINNNYGGPLPNDDACIDPVLMTPSADCDGGPNNQQNAPEFTGVAAGPAGTTVAFNLYSTPTRTFHVEIFDNPAMPPLPAGKQYRADTFVSTNGSGFGTGSFTIGGLTNYLTLTATDTVTGDTSEFSLVGSYVPTPAVSMSATALDFGSVNVGQTSNTGSVTLASTGSAPYHINAFDTTSACYGGPLCVGGDFTCTLGCSTASSYAPGTSCTISASFHPTTAGSKTSTIYICDNAAGSPRTLTLNGNGVQTSANVSISPATFNFGNVLVGQASGPQDFFVKNAGTGAASLGSISTSGDFNMLNTTCSGQLAPNASCKATVVFAPTLPGPRSGSLVAAMSNGSASASLSGTGTQQAAIDLPSSVDFGTLTLGTPATSVTVAIRNSGNAVVSFSTISVNGPFTLTNQCPTNLTPSQTCFLVLGFNPNTVGDFTGTLTVVSNAAGGSRAIPVSAHTVPRPVPLIRVTPGFIGFGDRLIGSPSSPQRIQIRNEGGAPAPVDMTTRSIDFLIVGSSCGLTIAPQGTCFADIAFQPTGFGARSGQFRVNGNSIADGQVTDLVGTGCRPFVPGTSRNHQQSGGCTP